MSRAAQPGGARPPGVRGREARDMRTVFETLLYVLVVVFDAERMLLVEEAAAPPGWYLPAGGVEAGETLAEAAVRETQEEAGVRIRPDGVLAVEQTLRPGSNRLRIRFVVRGVHLGGELKRRPDLHSLSAAWRTRREIEALPLRHPEVLHWFDVGRRFAGRELPALLVQ